ncbi:cytochrome b5 [Thecamonas trahens ATCC 50062]|uniref:Cytochrome b5 n=1 Tax=Thecamonas trahens ATCC 50062 TaxID=461836 RepID=A0A0L0D5J7_THETB|nr:cytochrome b5 [Thecamonas trahens ATCC 50062]KNC47614.1 cytochrome b5 [Thecamonas trahens ATCC 50062]|eukprot:XP_013759539.1 cytochrome b5 [Thecamonas trahens ATCC 50062]
MSTDGLPTYTLAEVKQHNTEDSLWMVIRGLVYDLTEYLDEHPGGDIMLEGAGLDATEMFDDVGHSDEAAEELAKYLIGRLA